jgi:hypothetical protein
MPRDASLAAGPLKKPTALKRTFPPWARLAKPLNQYLDQRPHLARREIAGRTQDKKTSFRGG